MSLNFDNDTTQIVQVVVCNPREYIVPIGHQKSYKVKKGA